MTRPLINLLVIRSKEPRVLAQFYELLGMKFQYHRHGNGPFHFSSELAGVVFEIYPLQKGQNAVDQSLRLGFLVPKLDDLISCLIKEGINILTMPTGMAWGYVAIIEDLEGRKIELKEKS